MIILLIVFFIYIWVRSGSKFLSFIATTVVMFSFEVTLFVTRRILGVDHLSALYIVALYYVQAIMAEPVLTFIETWKKSAKIHPEVFENNQCKRMAYTVRTTTKMFINTSMVIVLALLAQFMNPLKALRAFAVHGGICILFTYYLIIMFMPSACVAYDEYIIGDKKCKSCFKKK